MTPSFALWLAFSGSAAALEEIVVTGTRAIRGDSVGPVAVTAVTREQTVAPVLATDLYAYRPGAYVQQTTPGQGNVIVRGLKGSSVLNLVDGMRLNNALFRSAPNQYPALVDVAWIDRVEVARGPVSVLYGSDALGGAAQFRLRRPPLDGPARSHLSLAAGSASRRLGATGHWEVTGEGDGGPPLAALATLSYRDVGHRRTGGGDRIRPSAYRAYAARAAVRGRLGARSEWQVDAQFAEQPETPRVDELVAGFGQSEPSSAEFFFEPNRRAAVHGRWDHAIDATWAERLRADMSWQRIDDDRRTRAFGSPRRRLERNRSDLFQVAVQAEGAVDDLSFRYGLDATWDQVASARWERVSGGPRTRVPSRFPDDAGMAGAGSYVSVSRRYAGGATLGGGLRWSWYDVDLPGAGGASGDDLSAQLGWTMPVGDALTWTANIGRAFRAPNVFDFANLGERPGNRFNIPNTSLSPETVFAYDTGLRWAGARWRGELSLFALDYDDRIVAEETGAVTDSGRRVVQSRNVAASRIYGLEAGVDVELADDWSLFGVLNHTRGTERAAAQPETPADRIPPLNGRLGVAFGATPSWRFETYALFAARQDRLSPRDVNDPRIDPRGTPGWATFNVAANYTPAAPWRVSLALENLFDRRYREHGSGIDGEGFGVALSVRRLL